MRVLFRSREPEAIAMHALAKARSEFVFRRLAWLISKATVSLSDINGPRGGVDKRCQVEVLVNREKTIVATSIARDWRGAIDLALTRAARTLVRKRPHARLRRVRAHVGMEEKTASQDSPDPRIRLISKIAAAGT